MIVPSMTLEEIKEEIRKDYPILKRKSEYVAKKMRRTLRPARRQEIIRLFDYTSKYKNTWIYLVNVSKKHYKMKYLVYYYGHRGLTALQLGRGDQLMYCTAHFFQRYNERLQLNLTLPVDILHTFMEDGHLYQFEHLEEVEPGIFKTFGAARSGVVLGMYNEGLNLYKANTFLTNDMLRGDQVERQAYLAEKLDVYKGESATLD